MTNDQRKFQGEKIWGRRHRERSVELGSNGRPRRCLANETLSITRGRKRKGYVRVMRKLNRSSVFVHVVIVIFAMSPSVFKRERKTAIPDNLPTVTG